MTSRWTNNGYYDFDIGGTANDPELYQVEIAPSNFAPGGALVDHVFTGVAGADPNIADSNPTEIVPRSSRLTSTPWTSPLR
ncbi:MAG: hypothetical protein R3A10_16150 [Caldilineaceae bacterium]